MRVATDEVMEMSDDEVEQVSDDVLVVGGGLGGCLSALTVARDRPDLSVRLLSLSPNRFDYHSGVIDILGYQPSEDTTTSKSGGGNTYARSRPREPVVNPFDAIETLDADHPYQRVGVDALREGLSLYDAKLETYRGDHTERNALVVTARGRPKPAGRYPAGMAGGLASRNDDVLLVGVEQVPDFDVTVAATTLRDRVPYTVGDATISFPGDGFEYPAPPHLAARLDDAVAETEIPAGSANISNSAESASPPASVPAGAGRGGDGTVDELVEAIRAQLDIEPRIGVPAVLGVENHDTIRRTLGERLHATVFEVPVGPPSIPGRRLQQALFDALEAADVTVESDVEVVGFESAEGTLDTLVLDGGKRRRASAFVLATGDLSTGGLTAERRVIREPVFDCPVSHPETQATWAGSTFLDDHQFARAGLETDEQLRPVEDDGCPVYENLYAVGRILAGPNYDSEQSGDGVAVATGYQAGRSILAALF